MRWDSLGGWRVSGHRLGYTAYDWRGHLPQIWFAAKVYFDSDLGQFESDIPLSRFAFVPQDSPTSLAAGRGLG